MSIFSEKLNAIIIKKRVSLADLAQSSGITTALISKIKTGKRLPESEEKIIHLIRALHCTLEQETDLLNEYRIEKIGRDKYLCMLECHKCIETLVAYPPLSIFSKNATTFLPDGQKCIVGSVNINSIIHNMIDYETEQLQGHLRVSLQPTEHFDGSFLFDKLSSSTQSDFQIEQIIPLYDSAFINNKDNVYFAAQCLKMAHYYGEKYRPYYYYKSDFAAAFFPFCILTAHAALLINLEYHSALYFSDKETVSTLNNMFDTLKERCHPLIRLNGTTSSYLKCYEKIFSTLNGAPLETLQLSYTPSILSVIPQQISQLHLHPSLAGNKYTSQFLTNYWQKMKYEHVKTIFYLEGLDLFMQTGRCYELPYESESVFTVSERKRVLHIFMEKCDSLQIIPILLRENSIKLPPELSIKTLNKHTPLFFWNPVHEPFSSCTLEENTIKENFAYFMEYIQTIPKYTYSQIESLELLHRHVEKYNI